MRSVRCSSAPMAPSTPVRPPRPGAGRDSEALLGVSPSPPIRNPRYRPGASRAAPGGTAGPRHGARGEHAVDGGSADGAVRESFHAKALIFSMGWEGDKLLVGTGPEGQPYEVRGTGRESGQLSAPIPG